ncbi:MAG: hypothetical protein KBE91_02015 [Bacteroidia bacterium]|nr:hypothetical protein [Bacteroidia bacterium]MBP9688358.1 hypothetical protein [Bacteroidia bacterium]
MPSKSTPNQLLALLYNELTPTAKNSILSQLKNDVELQQNLNDYAETIGFLNKAELDADPTSIEIIMEYSAKSKELEHA